MKYCFKYWYVGLSMDDYLSRRMAEIRKKEVAREQFVIEPETPVKKNRTEEQLQQQLEEKNKEYQDFHKTYVKQKELLEENKLGLETLETWTNVLDTMLNEGKNTISDIQKEIKQIQESNRLVLQKSTKRKS